MRVDRDLIRPKTNEISFNLEREISTGLSGRASWVYKNMRDVVGRNRHGSRRRRTPCRSRSTIRVADRVAGTADDQQFQTLALAAGTGTDRVFTNLGERGNADFQNVEFAINRRFSGRWMLLASFGMTWSTMAHTQTANGNLGRRNTAPTPTTSRTAPPIAVSVTTASKRRALWNYKVIGRYVMPWDIGFSGSWKVQSGFNYAPHHQRDDAGRRQRAPSASSRSDANRYPSVSILDLRLDKSFDAGRIGRFSPMVDVFNVLNSGVPVNVRTTNTATAPFQEVTTILNPRVIRFGFRYSF